MKLLASKRNMLDIVNEVSFNGTTLRHFVIPFILKIHMNNHQLMGTMKNF